VKLSDYVPVADAAKMMGLNPAYVRRLCREGKLAHARIGQMIFVRLRSAQAYRPDPLGRGRPKPRKRKRR
jgi:hypothetical protein